MEGKKQVNKGTVYYTFKSVPSPLIRVSCDLELSFSFLVCRGRHSYKW